MTWINFSLIDHIHYSTCSFWLKTIEMQLPHSVANLLAKQREAERTSFFRTSTHTTEIESFPMRIGRLAVLFSVQDNWICLGSSWYRGKKLDSGSRTPWEGWWNWANSNPKPQDWTLSILVGLSISSLDCPAFKTSSEWPCEDIPSAASSHPRWDTSYSRTAGFETSGVWVWLELGETSSMFARDNHEEEEEIEDA